MRADETITVSANSSEIADGLDLKVVAKLFAEAKNLEQFEQMLNTPDSAFCNLDLNGDGEIDYIRVVETGEGNKRLVVLQAILAKDIYQDVASIYVEKDETQNVMVQVVGDEYIYGTNYIIEPVYVYRPVIYDWFCTLRGMHGSRLGIGATIRVGGMRTLSGRTTTIGTTAMRSIITITIAVSIMRMNPVRHIVICTRISAVAIMRQPIRSVRSIAVIVA